MGTPSHSSMSQRVLALTRLSPYDVLPSDELSMIALAGHEETLPTRGRALCSPHRARARGGPARPDLMDDRDKEIVMLSRKKTQAHPSPPQEAELVERLRAGDRSAQVEVVRRYRRMLLHSAFAILHQRDLAEDVVQDTWILAFKNIDRFEGRSMLRTWLAGIAINQARMYLRQERRSPPLSAVLPASGGPRVPLAAPGSPSLPEPVNDVTAEQLVIEQESGRELETALRRLPVTQRSVLLLEIRGYSPAETRTTLGITEVARRVRLSRARARMRQVFRWDVRRSA